MAEDTKTPQQWLISCDESGFGGANHYGYGSLWMPWQRRGDFNRLFTDLVDEHKLVGECKWNRVARRNLPFFLDLVDEFFQRKWLAFHCIVCRKADIDVEKHGGSWDVAHRKHFTMLLTNKIRRCLNVNRGRPQTFRIWVDPIHSHYKKADEAVEVIANNVLAKAIGKVRPVDSVITHDSKETPSIQLCDLLLGAVMDAWIGKATARHKKHLQAAIAHKLGWPDLAADTRPEERKFNIWYFFDPARERVRSVEARPVKLLYPL